MLSRLIAAFVLLLPLCAFSKPDPLSYKVLESSQDIEVRQYSSLVMAEVDYKGSRDEAIKNGFSEIKDYLKGQNASDDRVKVNIPVWQEELINGVWRIAIALDGSYTISSAPKPTNSNISLTNIPARKYIAVTFSGEVTAESLDRNIKELVEYANLNKFNLSTKPVFAFYSSAYTPSALKKNEVMFELK